VRALAGTNLACREGRITGLLGANGSGKSTISKIITGVYAADSGVVTFKGRKVSYKNPHEAKVDGIAMVFQNLSLVSSMTVWENIMLGIEKKKRIYLDDEQDRETARQIVSHLMPSLEVESKVAQISPSEMQIVEIAKAIAAKPTMLILDEPTAALEQAEVKNLFTYLKVLLNEGVSIMFTSHRMWEVMEICDDVVIFRNGKDVARIEFDKEGKNPDKIVELITGEEVHQTRKKSYCESEKEPHLSIQHLSYKTMLKDISFTLKKGEFLGIGGLAGQGQYELMLALAGSYPSAKGIFNFEGKNISLHSPSQAIGHNILLVPGDRQTEGLFLDHSVYFNLSFPRTGVKGERLFTPHNEYRKTAQEIIERLSIVAHSVDAPVNTLSGGNQQKIVVGKWLSFDISVLLLVDPAKGVDVGAKRDLYEFIEQMVEQKGISVILYASDNEELIDYCDRVLVMYEGQIVDSFTGEAISEEALIKASLQAGSLEITDTLQTD
ncbi:MAG: sugar ABC transporter ATP-binding protein, partial [Spirochaetales bacterium]|nr:sugar ABC transporter ATP-binding protein [Spirochaetales bacterium]